MNVQINIQNLLLCVRQCGECPMRWHACHNGCFRRANHCPRNTWDIPRVISSGAVSPSVMGHDDGRPVQ